MTNEQIDRELGKIISQHYDWLIENVSTNITKNKMSEYNYELLHFIILELYNKSPEYKQKLISDGKVPYWIISSCGFQLRSSTSPFYLQIRRTKMGAQDKIPEMFFEDYDPTLWECYEEGMEVIGWYYKHLLTEKYINKLTFNELHKKYQISKVHLKRDVGKALELIREHCKNI